MSEINFQDEFQGADAGLARQLLNLRQTPSAALQRRVQAIPQRSACRERFVPRLAWAAVALIFVALASTSPAVRATLGKVEEVIGRIHLTIIDHLPEAEEVTITETQSMSLKEAQAAVSFDFVMPTYVPTGFTTSGQVEVWTPRDKELVMIEWRDAENNLLSLSAWRHDEDVSTLVGPDSTKTILINGQEAVVMRGGWHSPTGKWSRQDRITTLVWEVNGVHYHLMTLNNIVSLEELVAVAESVH